MSRSTSQRPSSPQRGAHGGGGSGRGPDDGGGGGGGGGGPLVKIAFARNQAEAEMLQGLLLDADVPSILKRSRGFDNPDFLSAGPHDLYVVSDLAERARTVLADTMVAEEEPESSAREEEARLRRPDGASSPGRLAFGVATAFLGALILVWVLYQLT